MAFFAIFDVRWFTASCAQNPVHMKQYFSEKNALTVVTGVFCFVMTIVSALQHSIWQAVAFALAFSFSVELICHRAKERR